jgi:hypothetical protein
MRRSRASHSTINSHRVSPSLQRRPPAAQIPIAEHVARRGPPNAPKSRFRPLAVFVRRPPAVCGAVRGGRHPKTFTKPEVPRLVEIRSFSLFTTLEADELGVPREEYLVKGLLKSSSYPGRVQHVLAVAGDTVRD